MKCVFLDIDGVCNNSTVIMTAGHSDVVSREMVERVNRICESTGAVVVISSSWRLMMPLCDLRKFLRDNGARFNVVGITPHIGTVRTWRNDAVSYRSARRGDEIQQWLDENEEAESFVILDDDSDMEPFMDRLVKTTFTTGLQDEHVEKALEMFGHG